MPTLVFYPTADAYIRQGDPDATFGNSSTLRIKGTTVDQSRTLLRFDLSSLGNNLNITSAKLKLTADENEPGLVASIHELESAVSDWVESEVSWNVRRTGGSWNGAGASSAGADYVPTAVGSITYPTNGENVTTAADLSLATVNAWAGSIVNLLIITNDSLGDNRDWYSKNTSTDAYKPQIEIIYKEILTGGAAGEMQATMAAPGLSSVTVSNAGATGQLQTMMEPPTFDSIPPIPLNYDGNVFWTTEAERLTAVLLATSGDNWVMVDSSGNPEQVGLAVKRWKAYLLPN